MALVIKGNIIVNFKLSKIMIEKPADNIYTHTSISARHKLWDNKSHFLITKTCFKIISAKHVNSISYVMQNSYL